MKIRIVFLAIVFMAMPLFFKNIQAKSKENYVTELKFEAGQQIVYDLDIHSFYHKGLKVEKKKDDSDGGTPSVPENPGSGIDGTGGSPGGDDDESPGDDGSPDGGDDPFDDPFGDDDDDDGDDPFDDPFGDDDDDGGDDPFDDPFEDDDEDGGEDDEDSSTDPPTDESDINDTSCLIGQTINFHDWRIKMRWHMACRSVNTSGKASFDIKIEVLACKIRDERKTLLMYNQRTFDPEKVTDKQTRKILQAIHALNGKKITLKIGADGRICGFSGLSTAGRKSFKNAGKSTKAALEVTNMGEAMLNDNMMREILVLLFEPSSHDPMQMWESPIVFKGQLFLYPWKTFPLSYAAAKSKVSGEDTWLQSKGKMNPKPGERRKKERLAKSDLLLGKAKYVINTSAGHFHKHDIQINWQRLLDHEKKQEKGQYKISMSKAK
ncbi:hypothetical protein ACFL54_05330 [Planctomycetota bacterium]